jgi:hypothetical protein
LIFKNFPVSTAFFKALRRRCYCAVNKSYWKGTLNS